MPSKYYKISQILKKDINSTDTLSFEKELFSILKFNEDISFRTKAKSASRKIFLEKFNDNIYCYTMHIYSDY